MQAVKISPRKNAQPQIVPTTEVSLKYLSALQRKKSISITKDWKFFTYGLYHSMMDKI